MLQAGYVFCHRCGHAMQEAYYYNNETVSWVQLFRTVTGKFEVAAYTPPYLQGKSDLGEQNGVKRFRLSPTNGAKVQGLQHEISVECYIGDTMTVATFVRSCPFCIGQKPEWDSVQEILHGLGNLPTYVIGVVGARTVGKSCWIHALSCPINLNKVNELRVNAYNRSCYYLSTDDWARERSLLINPTELNKRGKTRMMHIKKKIGNSSFTVASVLVMDFAGELFAEDKKEEFENEAAHIFRGGEGYSGVDAVVFMTDPLPETKDYSLTTTYQRARGEYNLLQNKPIAFVMNKADLLIKNPPMVHINDDENLPAVPLLTEYTFKDQSSEIYQKSLLQTRIALQNSILKQINELTRAICNETRGNGFLIKSTEPYTNVDPVSGLQEDMLNFEESMNVMDPLLWILNELDIFPIED